jgi:pyruvyltransferase
VYGDPALLFHRLFVCSRSRASRLVVVPHHRDYAQAREMLRGQAVPIVDLLKPPRAVAQAIASAEVVYSSSLHGIIVAEALGLPAIWVEFGDRVIGAGFKFRDYYLASGRAPPPPLDWRRRISFTSRHDAPEIRYPDLDALLGAAYEAMPVRSDTAPVPGRLVL